MILNVITLNAYAECRAESHLQISPLQALARLLFGPFQSRSFECDWILKKSCHH